MHKIELLWHWKKKVQVWGAVQYMKYILSQVRSMNITIGGATVLHSHLNRT